jgi:hypothetical protein
LAASGCAVPLYFQQDRILFPGDPYATGPFAPYSTDTVVLRLPIEQGGQAVAWFVPAPGVNNQEPGPVVIFFHGNAETIYFLDRIIEGYHRLGCSVLLPEYRGYGESSGNPSQRAIGLDAVRFYDELIKRADVDRARIVFHGRSLGGGVAADLAMRRRPSALILQSTFASVTSMARRYAYPPFLVRNPFRTDRAVARLDVPLLIFHGTRDEIIPVSHGRRLRDLAPKAAYIEFDCGHNDFPGPGNDATYWSDIAKFLRQSGVIKEPFAE